MTRTPDDNKKEIDWDEVDNSLQKVRFDDADDDDARRPKTSVDIKKGLHHCSKEGCGGCPYEEDCFEMEEPFYDLAKDSFALIQQLQAENAEKDERIQQLEAERDAAVADILYAASVYLGECNTCKNGEVCAACKRQDACDECQNSKCMCSGCGAGRSNWQWRGVTKEE